MHSRVLPYISNPAAPKNPSVNPLLDVRDGVIPFDSLLYILRSLSSLYNQPDIPQTYLNPDGFLGGLNLNRENTTLRPDYEVILRFYGFDLTIDVTDFLGNSTSNFGLKGTMTTTLPSVQTTGGGSSTGTGSPGTDSALPMTTAPPSLVPNGTLYASLLMDFE